MLQEITLRVPFKNPCLVRLMAGQFCQECKQVSRQKGVWVPCGCLLLSKNCCILHSQSVHLRRTNSTFRMPTFKILAESLNGMVNSCIS